MFDLTLSFDNGPEPEVTPLVLDVLRARDIRATFCIIGEKLIRPGGIELARRAHAEGHWIANHTWTHGTPLGELTRRGAARAEILRTQEAIGELAHPARLFRPFGGGGHLDPRLLNQEAVDTLLAGGFTCMLWNALPRDWVDPAGWCDTALRQCAEQSWSLMVLHDMPTGAMAHLGRFLDAAKDQGARFRQDLPPDCVPIREGRITGDLSGLVAKASGRAA